MCKRATRRAPKLTSPCCLAMPELPRAVAELSQRVKMVTTWLDARGPSHAQSKHDGPPARRPPAHRSAARGEHGLSHLFRLTVRRRRSTGEVHPMNAAMDAADAV